MKMMKKLMLASAVSFGVLGAGSGMAATDGSLDTASSEGNFDIFLVVGSQTRIWGLQDLYLDGTELAGSEETYDFCVFANDSSDNPSYDLTIASANAFNLNDANINANLPYKISISDGATTADNDSPIDITMNAGALPGQPKPADLCDQKQNATLKVWFDSDQSGAASGTYTDRVTLTVAVN